MKTTKAADKMITKLVSIWEKAPAELSEPGFGMDIWDLAALSGIINREDAKRRRQNFLSGAMDDLPAVQKFMRDKGWITVSQVGEPGEHRPVLCPTVEGVEYVSKGRLKDIAKSALRKGSRRREEQQHRGHDAFIVHEFSTGNSTAFSIKQGLARFDITTFVAPQDVPTGADEESTRQSALKDAKEIFVIITRGLVHRPGEAANELRAALDAGQEARIRPYRKKGITSKEAVEFLTKMGITVRKQCPEFDDASGVIEDILVRKDQGEYFTQAEVSTEVRETSADKARIVQRALRTKTSTYSRDQLMQGVKVYVPPAAALEIPLTVEKDEVINQIEIHTFEVKGATEHYIDSMLLDITGKEVLKWDCNLSRGFGGAILAGNYTLRLSNEYQPQFEKQLRVKVCWKPSTEVSPTMINGEPVVLQAEISDIRWD